MATKTCMDMWSVLTLLLMICSHCNARLRVQIGVVESSLEFAHQLVASVNAALEAAGALSDEDYPSPLSVAAPVEPDEILAVPAQVCEQASAMESNNWGAVIGGGEGRAAIMSAAAAARAGLPLMLVGPAPANASWSALALYPHESVLASACVALCESKGWDKAVILHEGSASSVSIIAPDDDRIEVISRQIPSEDNPALLRNLLLLLKKANENNFIIWCNAKCAVRVLDAAQRVGLLADKHSYIILNLEMHTVDLYPYSHGGANITGLMLFEPKSPDVQRVMSEWRAAYEQLLGKEINTEEADRIQKSPPSSLLLAYDATLKASKISQELDLPAVEPDGKAGCESGAALYHADTLLNYMRSDDGAKDNQSAIGALLWEADGTRRNVRLAIVELMRDGILESAGSWTTDYGVLWDRLPRAAPPPSDSMANQTFNILIAINGPYVMRRESTTRLSGNEQYEGFCIDLIEKLAEILKFNYTYVAHPDKNYGGYNETTGEWTGMMKTIREDPNIHFALTDLTITAERERGVDFTTPFMNLGISILYRKPKPPAPKMFAFLDPFSNGVWVCLAIAYVGTSLVLYVVGRLCPEEWQNPYPCIEEPEALENQFTITNSFWFNVGALLLQGSEIAPIAYGTRTIASAWWLFALVIVSSYMANLATLLAKKTSEDVIRTAEDLAYNSLGITYGAKNHGSTYTFFQHSKSETFQIMYEHMKNNVMPENNDDGIKRVVDDDGLYAFLAESTTIEYTTERNCLVTMVGGFLDSNSKGYGIAMRKGSIYRQELNLALLRLQEKGVLREMKQLWWKEKHGGGACQQSEETTTEKLGMKSFLGLYVVLGVGCAIGVVISCIDLLVTAWKHPRDPQQSFTKNFMSELRFVFQFHRSEKPLQGPLTEPVSASPSHTEATEGGSDRSANAGEIEEELETAVRSKSRSPSPGHATFARRRSSMHNASVRLARHTRRRDSSTPGRTKSPHQRH